MSSRTAIRMSAADVEAHQRKHGFPTAIFSPQTAAMILDDKQHAQAVRMAKRPNKTEAEFGRILEARKRAGEVEEYHYEGLTLRWGDGMRYTPDYLVFSWGDIVLIEVKNAHIWSRDLVRFKGCRAEWKRRFKFELHQKKKGEWRRIL